MRGCCDTEGDIPCGGPVRSGSAAGLARPGANSARTPLPTGRLGATGRGGPAGPPDPVRNRRGFYRGRQGEGLRSSRPVSGHKKASGRCGRTCPTAQVCHGPGPEGGHRPDQQETGRQCAGRIARHTRDDRDGRHRIRQTGDPAGADGASREESDLAVCVRNARAHPGCCRGVEPVRPGKVSSAPPGPHQVPLLAPL
jgi:plasmid stabilization system protein ParE